MIFDRTEEDITKAYKLRKKMQNGEVLTEDEINSLERGTLTINTLNRIETKIAELKSALDEMDYRSKDFFSIIWNFENYFKQADFDRILQNVENLRSSFLIYNDTPNTPNNDYRKFSVINDVEKILYDLETMIKDIVLNYKECGNTECGGD